MLKKLVNNLPLRPPDKKHIVKGYIHHVCCADLDFTNIPEINKNSREYLAAVQGRPRIFRGHFRH